MKLSERYRWEAERPDGTLIYKGGDLAGCVRFSLVPAEHVGLPRHDFTGVGMVRRFGRGFLVVAGPKPPEYLHCLVGKGFRIWVRCSDGGVLVTPEDEEVYL